MIPANFSLGKGILNSLSPPWSVYKSIKLLIIYTSTEDNVTQFKKKRKEMSMDMMATERVCYVHCNFCNTILAVHTPPLILLISFFFSLFILSLLFFFVFHQLIWQSRFYTFSFISRSPQREKRKIERGCVCVCKQPNKGKAAALRVPKFI